MSQDRWTAEEYREYLRTQREPGGRRAASPTCCQIARPPSRAEVEEAWARAEREGQIMMLEIPAEPEAEKPKRRQKYGNQRTEVDGLKFDSKHEAEVYQGLKLREKAGELRCVLRQVGFDLPGGIRYFADFMTVENDYSIRVLDAKSEATRKNRVYINKKKQIMALYGIDIEEV